MMDQHIRMLAADSGNGSQRLHRLRNLLLETFGHHDLLLDIHLPTSQFGSEARVLPALADRERKLVRAHRNFHALSRFIHFKGLELSGLERVRDEIAYRRIPT